LSNNAHQNNVFKQTKQSENIVTLFRASGFEVELILITLQRD